MIKNSLDNFNNISANATMNSYEKIANNKVGNMSLRNLRKIKKHRTRVNTINASGHFISNSTGSQLTQYCVVNPVYFKSHSPKVVDKKLDTSPSSKQTTPNIINTYNSSIAAYAITNWQYETAQATAKPTSAQASQSLKAIHTYYINPKNLEYYFNLNYSTSIKYLADQLKTYFAPFNNSKVNISVTDKGIDNVTPSMVTLPCPLSITNSSNTVANVIKSGEHITLNPTTAQTTKISAQANEQANITANSNMTQMQTAVVVELTSLITKTLASCLIQPLAIQVTKMKDSTQANT